jgi:glucose/arabinose dehydrogenase
MARRSSHTRAAASMLLAALATLAGCSNYYLPLGNMTVNFPGFTGDAMAESELRERIKLPPGFAVNTYASGIENARILRFTETGDLLVSSPRQGKVFLLARDPSDGATAAGRIVLLDDLNKPHGIALHDGWLYVAETDAVVRVRFDAATRRVSGTPERFIEGLPSGGNHWTRTIDVGPDGKLYVSVGSSCNACEDDKRRATILRFDLDGSHEEIYASGLRNSVDFAWQPGTGDLYATDNGRDMLGDDFPPCELNRVVQGGFYGWPYANGDRVPDPDMGKGKDDVIARSIPPVHGFKAHVAPLGMTFYTGTTFPERYRGAIFVAQHGSWNRSTKSGYQVVAVFLDGHGGATEEPFMTGFEIDEHVYGRPVDVEVGPEGGLYVSDDFTGSIYRVVYGAAAPLPPAAAAHSAGGAPAPHADPLAEVSMTERSAASGQGSTLWADNGCAACHVKVAGQENRTYRELTGLKAKYTIDTLVTFLRAPQPPMPAFPLTDAQRRALAIFLLDEHP